MNKLLKRLTDVVGSGVGLVLLSPVFLIVTLIIRLGSNGPAFFKQTRVGQFGRLFQIIKFRTMVPNAEHLGPQITSKNDARITRVGRVLRKTKLDELPQLINVFKGDMSLVGPRPEVPKYVKYYDDNQRRILLVKPGITDPASIAFRNESELICNSHDWEDKYVKDIMPAKLQANLNYQKQANWLKDLGVILKTVWALFDHKVKK